MHDCCRYLFFLSYTHFSVEKNDKKGEKLKQKKRLESRMSCYVCRTTVGIRFFPLFSVSKRLCAVHAFMRHFEQTFNAKRSFPSLVLQ